MRPVLILLLSVLTLGTAAQDKPYPKPQIASAAGELGPNFTLQDQDGKSVELAALRGKPVLLYFYRAHW